MQNCVIIASGQSLTEDDVKAVQNAKDLGIVDHVIAVSNVGLDHAPWADMLVSHDTAWWVNHMEALKFKGEKYSAYGRYGTKAYLPVVTGCNSGLLAMFIARDILKVSSIALLGFDMHGTHYFGKHKKGLKNTTPERFKIHIDQFKLFNGCNVVNCTKDSALNMYAKVSLSDTLRKWQLAQT